MNGQNSQKANDSNRVNSSTITTHQAGEIEDAPAVAETQTTLADLEPKDDVNGGLTLSGLGICKISNPVLENG